MKKLGFVTHWYGENIPGGAESELRGLVEHLYDKGVELEVLATCGEMLNSDWSKNYHQEGLDTSGRVPVRRFRVRERNEQAFNDINKLLMAGRSVSYYKEQIFMKEMINSPDLYSYIRHHKDEYSLFVFIPYMFSPIYYGSMECPEKSVYIPCFHDEAYARMKIFKELYPNLLGMMFNSLPEKELAEELYDLSSVEKTVLGVGLDTDAEGDGEAFKNKYNIKDPFILYAGRKTEGKKVDLLLDYFREYKKRRDSRLKLVLIGGDEIRIPSEIRDQVMDLGFVDAKDKTDAYRAASLLCQPSPNESFSIVVMESWLQERPVLVSGACAVTKNFVKEANGGLYFEDYPQFEACLDRILSNKEEAEKMGRLGRQYVIDNFSWDAITKKCMDFLGMLDKKVNREV